MNVTPEDVAALWRLAGPHALTNEQYLRFLAQFPASTEELRRRPVFCGEPFRLD